MYLHQFEEETDWFNDLVLGTLMPDGAWKRLPRLLRSWLRNYIGGTAMYFISGLVWCFYTYWWKRKEHTPTKREMVLRVLSKMKDVPWYSALAVVSEYMAEKGWTRCLPSCATVREVDLTILFYVARLAAYLIVDEFGFYWWHRSLLHGIKPLDYVHGAAHHQLDKTASTFAGMALDSLDGILRAAPQVMVVFIVSIHLRTHVLLLFCKAAWTANIRDCIDGKASLLMSSAYVAIHNRSDGHNFGNYTVCFDWMFGTLQHPDQEDDYRKTK